jgi:hypothetical protein|eukprot:scaffold15819_cov248-Alexandrium_tamarense.AAC.1
MNTYISLPKTISNNKLNNKLIVDFPRHGRRTVSSTSVEASNNAVSTTYVVDEYDSRTPVNW